MTRRRHAFTLVELLIAATLSGLVLLGVFFVFTSNTRQYYTQEQILQMQESMRFATEYLKTDLRNSGQMAIVNGDDTNRNGPTDDVDGLYCRVAGRPGFRGVRMVDNDGAAPAILRANRNGLRPDRVEIMTDATGGTPLRGTLGGTTVTMVPGAQQFSHAARQVLASEGVFETQYRVGHFLRVSKPSSKQFDLVAISGVNYGGGIPTVTLAEVPCVSGGELLVNAVQFVRYRIATDPPGDVNAVKTNLVREVLNARDLGATVLDDSTLTVAEFVVNLQIWGTYEYRLGAIASIPADADPTDDIGNWPAANEEGTRLNETPHRLRALNVLLATRSPREDPQLALAPDIAIAAEARIPADRSWFDVVDETPDQVTEYARVLTLTTTVETPNLRTEANK